MVAARTLTKQEEQLLLEEVMLRAREARHDTAKLIEFVMRDLQGRRVKVPPHHRLAIDFIESNPNALLIWPIGSGKTYVAAAEIIKLLGEDNTSRGAVLSASQAQAEKTLRVVSNYITYSPELRLVYPKLKPSTRPGDAWTQHAIIVERPPGNPDPSVVAIGQDTKRINGSRLAWVVVDDILNDENTATPDAREKLLRWFEMFINSRLDKTRSKVIVCNTVYNPEDLIHHLRDEKGWATLHMDVLGNVRVQDSRMKRIEADMLGLPFLPWDHPELVDAGGAEEVYRLRSHGPDPEQKIPLWYEKFFYEYSEHLRRYPQTKEEALLEHDLWLAKQRNEYHPVIFNCLFMGQARDEATAWCKKEWVEKCKRLGRQLGHHHFVPAYNGPNPTFTGVDLAFSQDAKAGRSALFTFEQLPDGRRKILDIEMGRWDGPTLSSKVIEKEKRFNSITRVEGNAAQRLLRDLVNLKDASVPIASVDTTRANKHHVQFGVQAVFVDFYNGAWIIPNDANGKCHPATDQWLKECLNYMPDAHTGDVLMSCWLAREQARAWGALGRRDTDASGGAPGMAIMSR